MEAIKRNRLKIGLSQTELASKLGVKQSTVAMWETGANSPQINKLPELAKILGCTIDELFIEKGAGKNE